MPGFGVGKLSLLLNCLSTPPVAAGPGAPAGTGARPLWPQVGPGFLSRKQSSGQTSPCSETQAWSSGPHGWGPGAERKVLRSPPPPRWETSTRQARWTATSGLLHDEVTFSSIVLSPPETMNS